MWVIKYLPPINPKQTEKLKHFWVEENKPYGTWAIVEAFPGGTVRSPFDTKEEAIKREREIGVAYEWNLKQVPSPQEKFPKQHEALKGLYPYDILEYHDDGDLTVQSYEPLPRPKVGSTTITQRLMSLRRVRTSEAFLMSSPFPSVEKRLTPFTMPISGTTLSRSKAVSWLASM